MFVWPLLLLVIGYFLITGDGNNFFTPKKDQAQELLKERFVNGEIDEETYKRMKAVLRK